MRHSIRVEFETPFISEWGWCPVVPAAVTYSFPSGERLTCEVQARAVFPNDEDAALWDGDEDAPVWVVDTHVGGDEGADVREVWFEPNGHLGFPATASRSLRFTVEVDGDPIG